jgi:small-conductance mechanosensitive channel
VPRSCDRAPQASDLIKILGISGVAIGFAFQNILQNFLAGLLLFWSEPFRIGDEIKVDNYEGGVEEIQTRATTIKTYDGRQIVIPNADLFTHSVTINTTREGRRWEYDLNLKGVQNLDDLKSLIVKTVSFALIFFVSVAVALRFVKEHAEPILRTRVIGTLSNRFNSKVELASFHVSVVNGIEVSGKGLKIFGATDPNPYEPGCKL